MPSVNPEILVWARETAGLSVEEAARKLGISNSDRLAALESGERDPTRKQLTNMAKQYHRSLLVFYLPEPPKASDKGQDFRTLPGAPDPNAEVIINTLVRDIHVRQGLVRAALEEAGEAKPLAFVGTSRMADGVDGVAKEIGRILNFTRDDYRKVKQINTAFTGLREAAEGAGVFVLLMGNLGSHHTDINVEHFRGFALADSMAPFVVINEKDSRTAWVFTLLHELTHIFLGETGISGYSSSSKVERFCNSVAARFLLESTELQSLDVHSGMSASALVQVINNFAAPRNISRKMVAYNLADTGAITWDDYMRISQILDFARKAEAERRKTLAKQAADNEAPIIFNTLRTRRHRMGKGLVGAVARMFSERILTTAKAAKVLGVRPTSVSRLIKMS